MSLILHRVLEPEDLARLRRDLAELPWLAGKRSAGAAARAVKENLQAAAEDKRTQALEAFVAAALKRHPLFEIAARPRRLSRLMFSRYAPGMAYGPHTDDALMGGDFLRTDLAVTLFLSDSETYDGGELVIDSALGQHAIRCAAGDAVLYPAGSVHHVAPVTRGERLAAVGWVQSLLADPSQREILFDLSTTRVRLTDRADQLALDKTIANLLRMWAKP